MAELPQLTLAFLQRQPAAAARTLETLPAEDAAALLMRAPVRVSVPVVTAMSSIAAARCAEQMEPGTAAAICESLPWADASAVLRRLEGPVRDRILAQMPTALARRFRRSLEYAEDTVGAWIEMDAPVVVEDRTVGEASRLVAQIPELAASHVLLANEVQRYTGILPVAALLRGTSTAALGTLADRACRPVRDSASIASVASSPDWETTNLLPVVNHRGELLGGLSRRTLGRALHGDAHASQASRPSIFGYLVRAYLIAGEGLLRLLLQNVSGTKAEEERT
jgi:Mg/Co/Ni transporter MgtE